MSKHMQLTATVRPYYPSGGMGMTYPKLARHLGHLAPELVAGNPSLYELAGQLDRLLYRFEGTPIRQVLLRRKERLLKVTRASRRVLPTGISPGLTNSSMSWRTCLTRWKRIWIDERPA